MGRTDGRERKEESERASRVRSSLARLFVINGRSMGGAAEGWTRLGRTDKAHAEERMTTGLPQPQKYLQRYLPVLSLTYMVRLSDSSLEWRRGASRLIDIDVE